jgi:hypothetical protein
MKMITDHAKNEVVIYGNWLIALFSVLIPMFTSANLTTPVGVVAFVTAAIAVVMRSQVYSEKSVEALKTSQG